jgi:hypothetical protein
VLGSCASRAASRPPLPRRSSASRRNCILQASARKLDACLQRSFRRDPLAHPRAAGLYVFGAGASRLENALQGHGFFDQSVNARCSNVDVEAASVTASVASRLFSLATYLTAPYQS